MAGLDFCSKHNMVAYLEKNDGNTEFHQIMDFLTNSSIHFALTVSPIVSTSFVKQFWTSTKSRIVNNISYIDALFAGKPVTISEASIRSDLLFDDADGIDTLNNQAIFDTIPLMEFLQIFLKNQLRDVPVPMDHFPVPTLTKKVLSFMVKKGKNFLGNVTPLFNSMLVQPTEDKGEFSERPSQSQPIPSPTHPTEDQPESQPDLSPRPSPNPITNSNLEGSGGNHGGQSSSDRSLSGNKDGLTLQSLYDLCIYLCTQVTSQVAEIKDLKAQIKQLKKKARPGRKAVKSSKCAPSLQTNTDWDGLDIDLEASLNEAMDYTLAQEEGKTDSKVEEPKTSSKTKELHLSGDTLVVEDKRSTEKGGSTKSTDLQQSTVKPDEDLLKVTASIRSSFMIRDDTPTAPTMTSTPTPTVFGDDETIAQVLVIMSQNKIDPKAKGKGMIGEEDESNSESEDINKAEKKFKNVAE
ncbi:hypothetical protein Tco_1048763 [Tanacetum coccineum]